MKFVVCTLGCKVNYCESQAMMAILRESGFEVTEELVWADCYIINTCSITQEADKKSRQMVAKLRKLNDNAKIYVCGCSSQNKADVYIAKNIDGVLGTSGKSEFVKNIAAALRSESAQVSAERQSSGSVKLVAEKSAADTAHTTAEYNCEGSGGDSGIEPIVSPQIFNDFPIAERYEDGYFPIRTRTRSFVKVQDGCNNFCSYCIVPYVRGRSRSRGIDSILAEIAQIGDDCREIILTGINLSAYGLDINSSLLQLIRELKFVNKRKRLGSLECNVITEELLASMRDSGFCDHFHLSLQSGCDTVLHRMNRKYTTAHYLAKVKLIRQFFPNAGLTTDIITGFPQETDSEHQLTLAFLEQCEFSDIHVFPYSAREGTKAYELPQVDMAIRQQRAEDVNKLRIKMRDNFLDKQVGLTEEVYMENSEVGNINTGYTSNYTKVYAPLKFNTFHKVKLISKFNDGTKGEIDYE